MSDLLSPNTSLALLQATQGDSSKAINRVKSSLSSSELQKIDEAAQDFEAVFLSAMMNPMFEGIEADAPFSCGKGEEVFNGMMLNEYGKIIAQTGGVGIADTVRDHMIRLQEGQHNTALQISDNTTTERGSIDETSTNN